MANKSTSMKHAALPLLLIVILVVFITMYFVSSVKQGAGTTVSQASRDTFLTPNDDILSLEQDLNNLSGDPVAAEEAELNTIE